MREDAPMVVRNDTRAGRWRTIRRDGFDYKAYVPADLQDVKLAYTGSLAASLAKAEFSLGLLCGAFDALSPEDRASAHERLRREEAAASFEFSQGQGVSRFEFVELLPSLGNAKVIHDEDDDEDIANLVDAMAYTMELSDGLPVSRRLLANAHYLMCQGWRYEKKYPGEVRWTPAWVSRVDEVDLNRCDYVAPVGDDLDRGIARLEDYIHEEDAHEDEDHRGIAVLAIEKDPFPATPALVRIALAHYQIEALHPFIDGNGRIGRILTERMLVDAGRLPEDCLLLSETLRRHNKAYYQLIEDVEKFGDYETWVAFFCDCLAEAADYTLSQLKQKG
ncbi:MAG: Fic family protein [Atopobiaceae bacterium]